MLQVTVAAEPASPGFVDASWRFPRSPAPASRVHPARARDPHGQGASRRRFHQSGKSRSLWKTMEIFPPGMSI